MMREEARKRAEALVETVLDDAGIFYNKSEVWNLH